MQLDPKFLECRFEKMLRWKLDEGGSVIIFRPRFGSGRAGRWLQDRLGIGDARIRLDEIGTIVWKRCDGETPARLIAEELRREFGQKIEPAEHRLRDFIMKMCRARMVKILGV